jgi:hypothetical protein
MSKTTELKNTTALVKAILEEDQRARNSDSFLYFQVLQRLGKERDFDLDFVSVTAFLLNMAEWGFPPFESVRRARQKLQAEFPELSANKKVAAHRAENEEAFRQFAREGVC